MKVWALVPARGGSKSIPLKNLATVDGTPLLDFGVRAALASGRCSRVVCSTDDDRIADRARHLGIEVDRRPDHLATDAADVADVARDFLTRACAGDLQALPDVLMLIQPTSPFLLESHIVTLIDAMAADPGAASAQTVTAVPHNHHAWNQRRLEANRGSFRFPAERAAAYNKQRKEKLYVFGNLVAVRPAALLAGQSFFAEPSIATVIDRPYDLDVDDADDLKLAGAIVRAGFVELPHMRKAKANDDQSPAIRYANAGFGRSYRDVVLAKTPIGDYPRQMIAHIFHDLVGIREGVVLDLGCGRGDQIVALEANGFKALGIDGEPGPYVSHVCDFAQQPLPLPDASVDAVFSKSVIEHLYLPQIRNYMNEIMRVLRPGGYVIIMTPDWIYCWDDYYDGFSHITPFTTKSLGVCLNIYGFTDIRTHVLVQLPQVWKSRFWRILADVTAKLPLSKKRGKWVRWSKERQAIGIGRKPWAEEKPNP